MKFDLNAPNPLAPFRQIPAGRILENVLQQRLPQSALMYNMMKLEELTTVPLGFKWYTLHGTVCSDSWIVVSFEREEKFLQHIICKPERETVVTETIEDFKDAMRTSTIMRWNEPYLFTAVDDGIVEAVVEVITEKTGKSPGRSPSYEYWMPVEQAKAACLPDGDEGVVVKSLEPERGSKLLVDDWPYKMAGSLDFAKNQILHFPSAGVYKEYEIVAGILTKRDGTIGMTYTLPQHRQKGYGKLATLYLTKQLGDIGLIPCLHVTVENEASKRFHEKLHFQLSHHVSYLFP